MCSHISKYIKNLKLYLLIVFFFHRQSAAKSGLETLRALAAYPNNAANILDNYLAESYSKGNLFIYRLV